MAGLLIFGIVVRFTFPQFTENSLKAGGNVFGKLLERIQGMAPVPGTGLSTAQQAHFTALDGTVRVKKGNGNSWVVGDYSIPLEKGDVVQTGSRSEERRVGKECRSR